MRVFFICSPRSNLENARAIFKTVEEKGYKHTTDFVSKVEPHAFYRAGDEVWQERYKSWVRDIAKADICVFEVSIHSLAVGQLIQEAIRREKPVIALYYQGQKPHFLRGTEGSETRVQLVEYTLDSLKDILADAFDVATELLTTRFTMLMPPDMTRFLDKIGEERSVSRSEYIRSLITREMKRRK